MNKKSERVFAKALPVKEESTPANMERSQPKNYPDAHIEFQIQQAKDDIEFRYGFLEAEHPAQKFLEKLVRLIPDQTKPLTVRIAANWNHANACAFEDGLIIVSRRLIEDVPNQEALLGILCHEVRHVTGAHTKQKRDMVQTSVQEKKSLAEIIIRSTSISRLAEYDADLRGTIQTLRKMGVNPLGYKMFLEELAKRETAHDLAHGSSQDRINNLTDALFTVHIPSTEARLHPIPEEILTALKNASTSLLPEMSRSLMTSSRDSREEIKEKQQQRIERLYKVPDKWIPHIVRTAWEKRAFSDGKSKALPHERQGNEANKEFFQIALQRWRDMINTELAEEEEKDTAFSYIFFDQAKIDKGGLSDSMYDDLVPSIPKKRNDMQRGIIGWKRWAERWKGPVANFEEKNLATMALFNVYAQKPKQEFPWSEFDEDLHEWALAIQAVQEKRIHSSETVEQISAQIFMSVDRWLPVSDDLASREAKYRMQRGTPELGELGERVRPLYKKMYQQFLQEDDVLKIATQSANQLINVSKDITDRRALLDAVWMMQLFLDEAQEGRKLSKYSSRDGHHDRESAARTRMVFASVYIWKQLLEQHPGFAQLSPAEKRLETYLASTLGVSGLQVYYGKYEDIVPKKVVEQIAAWRSKEDVMAQVATQDDPGYLMRRAEEGLHSWNFYRAVERADFSEEQEVTNTLIAIGMGHLEKKDIHGVLQKLNEWKNQGVIDLMAYLEKNPAQCGPLVTKLTALISEGKLKDIPMQDRLRIATWISSPHVRSAFERACADAGWNGLTYDQKLQLTFPKPDERGIRDGKKREQLIEEEMGTREELHRTRVRFEDQVDSLLRDGNVGVGVATVLDINLRYKQSDEIAKYLEAMLQTWESDLKLKQLVYGMLNAGIVKEDEGEDGSAGRIDTKERKQERAMDRVAAADQAVNSLLALGDFSKHVILRKLLASPGGALTTSERRAEFFKVLFKKWVKPTPGQEGLTRVLDQIQQALIDSPQWELVFVGLQGSLRNALLIPPPVGKQTKWEDVYEIEEDLEAADLDAKRVLRQAVWSRLPAEDKKKPWKHPYSYSAFAEKGLWQALEKTKTVDTSRVEKRLHARSPLAFIKETASNMSAVGVRLLQNLPLAAEIPEEYAREFSEVFDNMKGQSKLAAMDGLELVWPEVWEEFDRIGKRIGGGSIVTVYEAVHASGREEVIKVQNPNIRLHITALRDFAKSIIATLAKKDTAYAGIESLVDDIHEWIEKDLEFEGFIEKDARFHAQHHGYQPEGFTYRILVPRSFGPANKYFSREERIRATNFTEWDELVKQGHDMREVVSLAVRSYVSQIQRGQALSDIHPGNLAVTKDKQLALYDRNYFLEFTPEQQAAIAAFINPFANSHLKAEAIKRCVPGLAGGGTDVQQQSILDFASAASEADWKRTQSALMRMRLAKIRLPIEMTLLLKNLQAFHLMAKKAGFKNLIEAMTFSP